MKIKVLTIARNFTCGIFNIICCCPKTCCRCLCSIRSMFILSSIFFLFLNATILNACNLSMFIPTTKSIHTEKNEVEDHVKYYLNEYSQFSQTFRDSLYNCGVFNFSPSNSELLECFSQNGYMYARHYPFKDVMIGLKLEGMGSLLWTTRDHDLESSSIVMYYVNQSWVYPEPMMGGINVYEPRIVPVVFVEASRFTSFLWSVAVPIPGMKLYLDNSDWFVGMESMKMDKPKIQEIVSRDFENYNQYDLVVTSVIQNQFDQSYMGNAFVVVNMNILNDFLDEIKVKNAVITLVNSENHYIISSTEKDVTIVDKNDDGVKHNVEAHKSDYAPLAAAYKQIKQSDDVNEDYKNGKDIDGRIVQARQFKVGSLDVIAIVHIPTGVMYQNVIISSCVYFTVSVLLLIFATCASCCCASCVTHPLSKVIRKMELIKKMELDKIKVGRVKSSLTEVRKIQTSLQFTVCKLKEYRAFLPTYVLGDEFDKVVKEDDLLEDEDGTSSATSDEDMTLSDKSGLSGSMKGSIASSGGHSSTSGTRSTSSVISHESLKMNTLKSKFDLGFRTKKIAIACIEFPSEKLKAYYKKILSLHKPGMIYQFYFDHVIIFIMKDDLIKRITLQMLDFKELDHEKEFSVQGRFMVCAGQGIYGNLGNHSIKKFAVGGTVMDKLNYIRISTPDFVKLAICSTIKNMLKKEIVTRMIDNDIFEVGRKSEFADSQEWMYELKEKQDIAKWDIFNDAVVQFKEHQYIHSKSLFEEFKEKFPEDKAVEVWMERIENIMEKESEMAVDSSTSIIGSGELADAQTYNSDISQKDASEENLSDAAFNEHGDSPSDILEE